jgi:hypothetical protein
MPNQRVALADYQDQRIEITGIFDKFSLLSLEYRDVKTALLQDVYAVLDGKEIDIGHIWLQGAEPLKNLDLVFGDRVKCSCRVKQYKKRLDVPNEVGLMQEIKYSLCFPTDVSVISRVDRPKKIDLIRALPNEESDQEKPISPTQLILEVNRVAKLAGGMDQLQQLLEALQGSN